jgi:diguanylate cyclase (GGDEF)-like protein
MYLERMESMRDSKGWFYDSRRTLAIIALVIVFGVVCISYVGYSSYGSIIRDDIMNISKLTSTNIYSEIDNELTKPIFVSLTMANDQFVKHWIYEETNRSEAEITNYLEGIREKYNYHSVFLVSDQTKNYYHYNGYFKTVSTEDAHDQWYYNFLKQPDIYILDVDQDEVDNHLLTIFINCKIFDDYDNVIGVTGVGVEMDYVQEMLETFEDTYNLEAFLVDENGLVQAHTNGAMIETRNVGDEAAYRDLGSAFYRKDQDLNIFHLDNDGQEQYIITHYIDELNWYLVVRKDTAQLSESFNRQIKLDIGITLGILIFVIGAVYKIIIAHQREIRNLAMTDALTSLANRRYFDEQLAHDLTHDDGPWCLFVIDVDGFKNVNDVYGHLQGDKVLIHTSDLCQKCMPNVNLARWGGDEFAGIAKGTVDEAVALLEGFRKAVESDSALLPFGVTVSIGITAAVATDTADSIVKRADQALYHAKTTGRNRITLG